jgi:hypothetical protein
VLVSWNVKERVALWQAVKLVQNPLPSSGTAAGTSGRPPKWPSKTSSTVTQLTQYDATSILLVKLILATSLHKRRIDDVKVGRVRETPSDSFIAINQLTRQSQFRQFNRDWRQKKFDFK